MAAFEKVVSARGRDFLRCLDCKGYTRPGFEAEHRCPRDSNGQLWRREVFKDPYMEQFTCPGCGLKETQLDRVRAHWCEAAEAVELFAAELEAAIEQARTEGALHALETAAIIAEAESNRYSSTWGENSAGDKALLNVAREIRARKGEQ